MNRVLFDLSYIKDNYYAGVAKYSYRILDYIAENHLETNYSLIVNVVASEYFRKKYPQFDIIVLGSRIISKFRYVRALYNLCAFKQIVNESCSDIVFCPWGNIINCLRTNKRTIITIHDLQLLNDSTGLRKVYEKVLTRCLIKHSDSIVTISEFAKGQIISYFPFCSNKVINLGNSVVMDTNISIDRIFEWPYVLYVGRLSEMKNITTLIKAYAEYRKYHANEKLVLVGKITRYFARVCNPLIESLNIEDSVIIVENCSEKDLSRYYRDCKMFVFPSLREGFGFPPIEASLFDVPVITTHCESLDEVSMGLLFQYESPEDFHELFLLMDEISKNPPSKEKLHKISSRMRSQYSPMSVCSKIDDFLMLY